MYIKVQEDADDVYLCNFCDAIFVTETSVVEHIKSQHKKILFDPDTGEFRPVVRSEVKKKIKAKDPSEDPSLLDNNYLERTYFVCDTCDDIFLARQQLKNHFRSEHEYEKGCQDTFQSKRLSTTSSKEVSRSRLCRITSPKKQNSYNKKKNEFMNMKHGDKNLVPSMKYLQENSIAEKQSGITSKVSKKAAKKYQCRKCDKILNNYDQARNHFLSHYYDNFKTIFPSNVVVCPICSKEHRDRSSLIRHYAFLHEKLFEVVPGLTKESMMKSIKDTAIEC